MSSEEPQQRVLSGSGSGSGSGRSGSGSGRTRQNPQQQLSQIEKSVTHLLVATKQLLETLTMWSRGTSTETEVSDVYVRLGYEFNIACRAFNSIGVETQDLGPVPDLLRSILEETLSQEASQASLDKFLPRIRDIIINLLHGLKKKQSRLRQKGAPSGSSRESTATRHVSTASTSSHDTTLTQSLEDAVARQPSNRSTYMQRHNSGDLNGPDLPPRTTSQRERSSPNRENLSPSNSLYHVRNPSRETFGSNDSSISSTTAQSLPVITPYPAEDTMPAQPSAQQQPGYEAEDDPPPPPPKAPPKQADALAALQRGGDLERRASRRFSAYQIQKHLGTPNGVPIIPPAQNSPIPNRGREAQESMTAVRTRGSYLHSRQKSVQRPGAESSPLRAEAKRISVETGDQSTIQNDSGPDFFDSPNVKTPRDKLGPSYPFPSMHDQNGSRLGATLNGPIDEPAIADGLQSDEGGIPQRQKSVRPSSKPIASQQFVPESSPQSGKELTLFLQYKSKIKKFVLPDGGDLTIARLQLAFIEKFAWNTHNNGVDLPEIYLQDSLSGIRHELEDLGDIKERSVLVLNVEALDEVKRHIDDGLGGLRRMMEGIRTVVDDQQTALQLVSERQQEAAKEMASFAAAPAPSPVTSIFQSEHRTSVSSKGTAGQLKEVQSLRRDLAVVRQTYSSFVEDINASMSSVRTKAASINTVADKERIPAMSVNTGRAYVNTGKKTLSEDSEKIVTQVDDLQDTVEDLRKDVVSRGVRPLPRQLETVSKDISGATAHLKKLQEYLKREKPIWTKIWEKELQVVCDDRDLLTMQEELCVDLEDDLEKAAATFALVEQATRQQNLQNAAGSATGTRSTSRTLKPIALDQGADPHKAKNGVLGDVKALQVNHDTRLEAIERAEKARQRELESRRGGEFQKELGNFVDEGKLKKSGGVDEVERLRKVRDERSRKEVWERQNARAEAASVKEAEKANGADNTNGESEQAPMPVEEAAHAANITFAGQTGEQSLEDVPQVKESEGAQVLRLQVDEPETDAVSEDGSISPEAVFVEAKELPVTPNAD